MLNEFQQLKKKWLGAIITILLTSLIIISLRLSGMFELLELKALDLFFVRRLPESSDTTIVLVTITEKDINFLKEYPLSDEILTSLLKKIKKQQPNVIGLDIFRDFPVPSSTNNPEQNQQAHSELLNFFHSTTNLIGIAKITNSEAYPSVNPPTILKQLGRVSAADLVVDDDGIVRRGNLFPLTDGSAQSSIPSLGLAVALNYLSTEGINPLSTEEGWLKLKNTEFFPFQANDGGYIRTDDSGYQILLNWHSCSDSFSQVSASEVLQEHIPRNLFKERIVLVGYQATSVKDIFTTSCSHGTGSSPNMMAGVKIQAHLASQIINSVLERRPLIKVWSEIKEYLWLVFSIGTVAVWGWKQRKHDNPCKIIILILGFSIIEIIVLIVSSYLLFLRGWWTPIIPTILAIEFAAVIIIASIYIIQLLEAKNNLEFKIVDRTRELRQTLKKLHESQKQLIIKEKQASLGTLSARIAHQIKNPLSLININLSSSLGLIRQFTLVLEENSLFFDDIFQEIFQGSEQILPDLEENLTDSQEQIIRINKIIQEILSYFRQEQLILRLTDFNSLIYQVIQSIKKQFQEISDKSSVKIITNFDSSIGQIEIVSLEIEKALINLLENACYTVQSKQEKIKLNYTPTITIETFNLLDKVEIRIRDNGEGIDENIMSKIFDPFWTTKPTLEGTGLGLFFVHQIIVEIHRGEIKVESVAGEYSQFIVQLPKR